MLADLTRFEVHTLAPDSHCHMALLTTNSHVPLIHGRAPHPPWPVLCPSLLSWWDLGIGV